jgi:hypothetical protein
MLWFGYFAYGAFALGAAILALDAWAGQTARPGVESYCRGVLVGDIPLTRAPLCFAVWIAESKSWLIYARDMLLAANQGLYLRELARTGDIAFFTLGGLAVCVALAWLWASAMTRLTRIALASSYLLIHAVSNLSDGTGRRHRRPA